MEFDYRISTGLGKQTLGGHKQNLVHTRTQEKGAVYPKETEPDLPSSVECSYGGTGQPWPAARTGALAAAYLGGTAHEPHHRATKQTAHKLENNYTKDVLALSRKF